MAKSEQKDSLLKRLVEKRLAKSGENLPPDPEARQRWPHLWDMLTNTNPDGVHALEPARLSISLGVGCWTISVNSSDLRTKLEATAPTLLEAFEAWERAAMDGTSKWKSWGKGEVVLRKRKLPEKS